ncbi:hypothetical protein DM02DRAFT_43771, partial [Periconia macrospinosa]
SSPSSPSSSLHIHRLTHATHLTTPSHPLSSYAATTLSIPGYEVLDAKFADDTELLILLRPIPSHGNNSGKGVKGKEKEEAGASCLISLPYTSTSSSALSSSISTPPTTTSSIPFSPTTPLSLLPPSPPTTTSSPQHLQRTTIPLSPQTTLNRYIKHVFEPRFSPLKIVVNGRKGRRVVVVLAGDGRHYRVLDLDFKAGEGRGGGEGGEEEEGDEGNEGDVRMGGV